jgi:hypothetical protein
VGVGAGVEITLGVALAEAIGVETGFMEGIGEGVVAGSLAAICEVLITRSIIPTILMTPSVKKIFFKFIEVIVQLGIKNGKAHLFMICLGFVGK